MLKGRTVTLKFERPNVGKDDPDEEKEEGSFEEKAEMYLSLFERIALRVFAGVAGYVVLDTYRRVQIAKAQNPRR